MVELLRVIKQSSNFLEFSWLPISTADSYIYILMDTLNGSIAKVINLLLPLQNIYKKIKNLL